MTVRRLPHLLVLTVLATGTATGLAACGSETLTDVEPQTSPSILPPDGEVEAGGTGATDGGGSISDLPTVTTSPTPAPSSDSGADGSGGGSTGGTTSGGDSSGGTGDSSGSTSTGGTSGGGTSGGAAVTPESDGGAAGGSGSSTSGGGADSGGGTSTGSSDSSGGASPSEFNEFCETNPGVCR